MLSAQAQSGSIARFTVASPNSTIATPVYIDLDEVTALPDSSLSLRSVNGKSAMDVPFQIEHSYHRLLWWMASQSNTSKATVYELFSAKSSENGSPKITVTYNSGALLVEEGNKKVLQYNYSMNYPPAGVDSAFRRSGFIHPLWSPAGNTLTQIRPKDHYHHMGIWNPWTDVIFRGRKIDFWNLGDKKGTVRFNELLSKTSGPVYGGFKAEQDHIVLNMPDAGQETVAMHEVWDVRVFNAGEHMWIWDFTSTLNCATPDTVFLKEYRYGGFGFRATPDWDNQNSKVLTSEGKSRKEADAGTARWCMIDGDVGGGHSGIVFMSSPTNYNYPEPMRVWPEDANKRGDVFFSFSPTRNKDWTLLPGRDYTLRYRLLVYDGTVTAEQAEAVWKSFAAMPQVKKLK